MIGSFLQALAEEKRRLARRSLPAWRNRIYWCLAVPPAVALGALLLLQRHGFVDSVSRAFEFWLTQSLVAISAVELGNYLQHYGLLRTPKANDPSRYEMVQAKHSWDSDAVVSNLLMLNVATHSHHHIAPSLGIGELQAQNAPQLPASYFALYWVCVWTPPLFFKLMDKQLKEYDDRNKGIDLASIEDQKQQVDKVAIERQIEIDDDIL